MHLQTVKGLRDLTPLLTAPALEELILLDMGHLDLSGLAPLTGHPALRRASMWLGSTSKTQAGESILGLPDAGLADARHPAFTTPG